MLILTRLFTGTAYNYAPVSDVATTYPTIWVTAELVSSLFFV